MIIKKEELVKVLNTIKIAVEKNDLPEMECFTFTGEVVFCFNNFFSISHILKTDFACSVKADEFLKIVEKCKDEDIDISVKNEKLLLKCKRVKGQITCSNNDEIYKLAPKSASIKNWKKLPTNFIEGINLCSFSTSKDASQTALSCVYVKDAIITSSDDVRISVYSLNAPMKEMLLPAKIANLIAKNDFTKYALTKNTVYFANKEIVFSSQIVLEEYPNCEEHFKFKGKVVALPKKLNELVDTASILAAGDFDLDKHIKITIANDTIKCTGENEIGWIESKTKISENENKEEITFQINPIFLMQILKKTKKLKVGADRALFTTKNFKHLVALY